MRRSVEQFKEGRKATLGPSSLQAVALFVLVGARASAGDGDLPVLTPPSDMPIVSQPSTLPSTSPSPLPGPARPPVTSRPLKRPMLALPGLTTPAARPTSPVLESRPTLEIPPGELSLDAPLEMKPQDGTSTGSPSTRTARPLVLESMPLDDPAPLGDDGGNRRNNPATKRATTPPQPVQAPSRRPRLFGFLPGQNPSPAPAPASSTTPKSTGPGRSVVEGLRDDPATESALKRRIERQAREVVGNRARSVEVKVTGKDAVVRAEGVKFFQKRAVRKQLESIPALAGLRSTIEIAD